MISSSSSSLSVCLSLCVSVCLSVCLSLPLNWCKSVEHLFFVVVVVVLVVAVAQSHLGTAVICIQLRQGPPNTEILVRTADSRHMLKTDRQTDRRTDGRTDGRTDRQTDGHRELSLIHI